MHQTVREFFLKPHESVTNSKFWKEDKVAHKWLATACIRYLHLCFTSAGLTGNPHHTGAWASGSFKRYAEYLNRRPFATYALSYVQYHMDSCGLPANAFELDLGIEEPLPSVIDHRLLRSWFQSTNKNKRHPSTWFIGNNFENRLLHTASYLGLPVAVGIALAAEAEVNCQDDDGLTPLIRAAKRGNFIRSQAAHGLPQYQHRIER